jgi:hypothetical protein
MVLVVFEMISPEMAEYLMSMDMYERELMLIDYKLDKLLV